MGGCAIGRVDVSMVLNLEILTPPSIERGVKFGRKAAPLARENGYRCNVIAVQLWPRPEGSCTPFRNLFLQVFPLPRRKSTPESKMAGGWKKCSQTELGIKKRTGL